MLTTGIRVSSTFNCSLERAFKTPILGDATKFLNGYFLQPPITGFADDDTWGLPGGVRYPLIKGSLLVEEGITFTDEILERKENEYWKWKIYEFRLWGLFFADHAIGEWSVKEIAQDKIAVTYTYTYYSKNVFLHPFTWLFCQIQIKGMMLKAMRGIKAQAESGVEYIYDR